MQFYERFRTDDSPARMTETDADLFLRVVSSFRKTGDRAEIDLEALEALYTDTADRSRRGRSRIVVLDGCRIFIDGKRVEGLSKLQRAFLAYMANTGTETLEALACNVWCNPNPNYYSIRVICNRISDKLEKDGFPCYLKFGGGTVTLKFFA